MTRVQSAAARRLDEFERECRRRGLPVTVQRRTIFEALLARRDHPSADQVYEVVRERLPNLSRTTVYRVLETLVELGAARKVSHPDSVTRFDPVTERHHHLVCEACGRLVDLEDAAVPGVAVPQTGTAGFTITSYSISFNGVCASCRRRKES